MTPKSRAWWNGMTLDAQEQYLARRDPAELPPGSTLAMPAAEFNKQKNRIDRARKRWRESLSILLKPCTCENCVRNGGNLFPRYYVFLCGISYECYLERWEPDAELVEDLQRLRGQREKIGSVVVAQRGYGYPSAG